MAKKKDFETLFEEARKTPEYCLERVILDFTEDVVSRMETEKISRSALAERINLSPAYITKILRGSTNFTLDSMVKIASALGCELHTRLQPKGSRSAWITVVESSKQAKAPFRNSRELKSFQGSYEKCTEDHNFKESHHDNFALAS